MKAEANGTKIVLQMGEELRITNNGNIVMDNPELELVGEERAADATLLYRFDQAKRGSRVSIAGSCGGPQTHEIPPPE
ncbi:MAG TPA: hypothetical protein VG322_04250 [Candidatus Acidoferrales bacterium]|nr:hypothetical protein [Candidatus Acidoferrales bacterium]